jgi:glucose/mannose-6-phosphate isomerase
MNLDDTSRFEETDINDILLDINLLPDQLEKAWAAGLDLPLPAMGGVRQILIAGMGASAIGAALVIAYAEPLGKVPMVVQCDYNLPAWASGAETLVIVISQSGETEEVLSVFEQAVRAGCRVLVITSGGQLSSIAEEFAAPIWLIPQIRQPRGGVEISFGYLLALFYRLNIIPNPLAELIDAIDAMRAQQSTLLPEVPVVKNPAKRQAGQLAGRWLTVSGSGPMTVVARHWKGQINLLAKTWGQFDPLPEANHNTIAGIEHPEDILGQSVVLFLRAPSDHPRNRMRSEFTQREFMLAGLGTDFYIAEGKSRLAHIWTAIHFGEYLAYYLAMFYGVDPSTTAMVEGMKEALKE